VRTIRTPVVVAVLALAGCGGGGTSLPAHPTVEGPLVKGANGVWIFRPAGQPKRLTIFFHGQGGPVEATPANHRPWIDHLVARGSVVIYPRYEISYRAAVMEPTIAGIRRASGRVDVDDLPVLALGYSRGAALAVEYGAVAESKHLPVPDAIESVNPVPFGEQAQLVDLSPLRPNTVISVLMSEEDPHALDGARLLMRRLETVDFPADQVRLGVARSNKTFVADHLAPLRSSPSARAAYWTPTDKLLAEIGSD